MTYQSSTPYVSKKIKLFWMRSKYSKRNSHQNKSKVKTLSQLWDNCVLLYWKKNNSVRKDLTSLKVPKLKVKTTDLRSNTIKWCTKKHKDNCNYPNSNTLCCFCKNNKSHWNRLLLKDFHQSKKIHYKLLMIKSLLIQQLKSLKVGRHNCTEYKSTKIWMHFSALHYRILHSNKS